MIPISLTIQGIYSYQQKQTINFEPLTNAGIFGIFGSVGSGKSTILEAISFALYGETERLHKRDDRAYNMMNLQSKEIFIDFIFKCSHGFSISLRGICQLKKKLAKKSIASIFLIDKFLEINIIKL